MNYLTQYYKNLSEQLQARVNHLQKFLNENDRKNPHVDWTYYDELRKDDEGIAHGEEHFDLADLIATHHANIAPHIKGKMGMDVAASKADILKHLNRKGGDIISRQNFDEILKDIEESGTFAPYSISAPNGEHDRLKYNKIMDDVRVSILDAMAEEA